MPVYDYRCNVCGRKAALFYKTYKDYDAANAENAHTCPHCGSHDLTRLISRVAIQKPSRDYTGMDSGEMLSVLEGGDSREVGRMMHQLGQDEAISDPAFGEITERLMKGDDPERIEADMGGSDGGMSGAADE
ncbi:MAG: zinc ribbon domain-containing protein [Anaerolineae bacterium]|nr:zinc ribbon domain-containing protein [Anaerolineae bacterium]